MMVTTGFISLCLLVLLSFHAHVTNAYSSSLFIDSSSTTNISSSSSDGAVSGSEGEYVCDNNICGQGHKYNGKCVNNVCVCRDTAFFESNGVNSRNVPDEERTCHHTGGAGETGFFVFFQVTVLVLAFISLGFSCRALYGLHTIAKFKMNIQTVGMMSIVIWAILTIVYWLVDPFEVNHIFPLSTEKPIAVFTYWMADIPLFGAFSVFFLYWRDISSKRLNKQIATRFVSGTKMKMGLGATVGVFVILLTVSAAIGTSIYFAFFYSLVSIVFTGYFIYFGYSMNKQLKMAGVSQSGNDLRARMNKIATAAVLVNVTILIVAVQSIIFTRTNTELKYLIDAFIGKMCAQCTSGLLCYAFWPRKAFNGSRTRVTNYTTNGSSRFTKAAGASQHMAQSSRDPRIDIAETKTTEDV